MSFDYPEICAICSKDFEYKHFSTSHGRVRCKFCGALYQVSPYMVDGDDGETPLLLIDDEYWEALKGFYDEYGVRYDRHRPLWDEYLKENYPELGGDCIE